MKDAQINEEIIREIVKNGVILGHRKSKTNPLMKPYISATRNEIELLNPENSWKSILDASVFLSQHIEKGALILLVGTVPAAKNVVESFAKEMKWPYVISRWLGGTLTNFSVIKNRISYYEGLKEKEKRGDFEKYTKNEQRKFKEEIRKLRQSFEGITLLNRLPDAVLIIDINTHETALREAKRLNIPVIGIVDTDDNPKLVDYPIFASDHSSQSISWVFQKIKDLVYKK